MTRKKTEKTKPTQELKKHISTVLAADSNSLKPFIQVFHYEPENITLQSLGSILGVFEIEDRSDDSAYIVNFLSSVIKKEYFSNPKRPTIESFESTLHKVNLALSELIKNDNTAWLGKLHASICVLEKNNLHFSVSGKAKTLLIRNAILTDISEGLTEESYLHPLKTFTEVSSGRLRDEDQIILTGGALFDLFSLSDIQKNAQRLPHDQLARFLKTAMVNQLPLAGSILIHVTSEEVQAPLIRTDQSESETNPLISNAFSQKAFSRQIKKDVPPKNTSVEHSEGRSNENQEYTDAKTGHIYVAGENHYQDEQPTNRANEILQEYLAELFDYFTALSSKTKRSIQRFSKKSVLNIQTAIQAYQEKRVEQKTVRHIPVQVIPETKSPNNDQQSSPLKKKNIETPFTQEPFSKISSQNISSETESTKHAFIKNIPSALKSLLPKISLIKNIFQKLDPKQKKIALGILAFIFIAPFIFIKIQGDAPTPQPSIKEEVKPVQQPLSQDKNIHAIASAKSILHNSSIIQTVFIQGTVFSITKDAVIDMTNHENPKTFSFPNQYGFITHATAMKDLGIIFLLTDTNKLIAFTPSNHVFTENTISLPSHNSIQSIATYLTYFYVLDKDARTIYRYPRITGGFENNTQWLKETVNPENNATIAINEDLFMINGRSILAFNRGKSDPISFENSNTPIIPSTLFAITGSEYLYVLDATNSRIVQFEKSGAIANQYTHPDIKKIKNFVVDEENKIIYGTTDQEVLSFNL